ncbi:MAG: methyl-accepting chemotaxis protein [Vicinamibacterales bacterium]
MAARLTFGARMRAGIILLIALIACIGAGAAWSAIAIDRQQQETLAAATRMRSAAHVQALNAQLQTAEKALIVAGSAGNQEDLERWHATVREDLESANRELDTLAGLVATDEERADVTGLRDGVASWSSGCAACHSETADLSDPATVSRLSDQTRELTARNYELANRLEERQVEAFQTQAAAATAITRTARWTLLAALVLGLSMGLVLLLTTGRATSRLRHTAADLRKDACALLDVADRAADTSRRLADASTGEVAALEQAAGSMHAMADDSRKTADQLNEATSILAGTHTQVDRSNHDLQGLETSMQGIADASNRVTGILKRIDELAFQTNLLALNAAVEAARVGEAGAGFAVVADEVRNLAQRSADAARDTGVLIDQSLETSAEGRQRTDALGASMAAVTGSVGELRQIVETIAAASQAQRAAADEVLSVVRHLQDAAHRTADMASETRTASDALQQQAASVTRVVEGLEDLVGHCGGAEGAGAPDAGAAAPPVDATRPRPRMCRAA